jgi:hypothetical protein
MLKFVVTDEQIYYHHSEGEKMLKVYIVGKYRDPNVIKLFGNIRRGIKTAARLVQLGFAPFCPFLDFLYLLCLPNEYCEDIGVDQLQGQGLCWLESSDCVFVIPEEVETSEGSQAEIKHAEELGIPVFTNLVDLLNWQKQEKKHKIIEG